MDNSKIRSQFPILKKITYFDSAALVLKPQCAIDSSNEFYTNFSISSRTQDTPLGNFINQKVHETRQKTADLIDAQSDEIIFTSGTTQSLNTLAQMLGPIVNADDVILLSSYNHSSNMIPWIELAKAKKAKIIFSENIENDINPKVKIVALAQETNNFNVNFDIKKIYQKCLENDALLINDAAQSIAHEKSSLKYAHALVFSTNKLYGPTGLGVLAIKKELLAQIKPVEYGGGTLSAIDQNANWTPKKGIQIYEPGTQNLAGIFMFNSSLDFLNTVGYEQTQKILKELSLYLHQELKKIKNVEIYTVPGDSITLINVKNVNAQDVATYLGTKNIYTIAGIFCAPYLRNIQSQHSFLRISLGIYNTFEDIDKLIKELKEGGDFYAF
ncbi:aminotransferase class V [Mycoplasmopsis pullorum]|uniref:aminotransferase class V-fold PLP-dependent enzyme n=5 Tax=Mycoplasmopsis pullorum TaxID=48003 RepID=UPI00111B343F|nr:aminotransferase class V-fold PLP-dependent enzyme [Mycoplasmopsis pullorum]TNK81765.1 aminotransferase class V [Mycoplasmopsis pullorum]TNK85399.1 aminotransferase class V [Mycoplasmopsis pullorum]TNK85630.1 aminotransferase class V [Mycoplasmopsis pullorum]TNK86618.1 aminotransferase class V [Mycoplasmopsis pullorum]TNK86825.1 aminotransferase class V [Mycoplasmopsis pullorum]